MPGLILSKTTPLSPLVDANMNIHRAPHDKHSKYPPPGLGYGNLPAASVSSPSLVLSPKSQSRRRSDSFTYTSGSTYASGNLMHSGLNTLASPFTPAPSSSRLGKRSALAAGLCYSGVSQQHHRGPDLPPPPRSQQGSKFFDFSTPRSSSSFDPFASDDQLVLPPASSTSYSHYWEYDPSTNGPKLCSSPPASTLLASPRPQTVKLPPVSSLPLPRKSSASRAPTNSSCSPSLAPLSIPDKNARAKLLAGILLNRIYAVGKPMRRPLGLESDYYSRKYVKSGLSRVVSIDY